MSFLDHFPEELLERILSDVIVASSTGDRPAWLRSPSYRPDFRLAPLLVTKQFSRIAIPLFYHTIQLHTSTTARLLHRTLIANPALASRIRHLSVTGISADAASVLRLCGPSITRLDITLATEEEEYDEYNNKSPGEIEKEFADALKGLTGVQHLTLRKQSFMYLSLPRPRYIITAVANAIPAWAALESVNIAFKLSDDTPTSPQHTSAPVFPPLPLPFSAASHLPHSPSSTSPPSPPPSPVNLGPISALTHALASAPCLHTFSTHLPSVWNVSILNVSCNPRLERIVLSSPSSRGSFVCMNPIMGLASPVPQAHPQEAVYAPQPQVGIVGTGLFLMEARRHARLTDLIKAGTYIIRSRARTLATPERSLEKNGLVGTPMSPVGLGFGGAGALGLAISGVTVGKERV